MNGTWTSNKSQPGVDTLKAMLVTKVNYDEACAEFFKMLLTKKDRLQQIHNSEKYSSFASFYF
jgi:ribosomal protein L16 Arg81 hydroxylase